MPLPMLLSLSPLPGFYAGQYIVSKFHAPNFVILMATTIGFLAAFLLFQIELIIARIFFIF